MDYDMPKMNGLEAAKLIREIELLRGLDPCKIIMVSGHCDKAMIDAALNPEGDYKIDKFLKKPVRFE